MGQKDEKVMKRVRVYELVSPDLLKKYEKAIKEVFYEVLKIPRIASGDFYFSIDEKNGWIVFKNRRLMFRDSKAPSLIPASKGDALAVSAEILKALQKALVDVKKYPFTKNLESNSIVPTNLKDIDVVAVPHPNQDHIDHLLCRFHAFLPVDDDGRERVQVLGSQVDLRIGHQNQLVSYSARWSPVASRIIRRELFPLESLIGDDGHDHDSSEPDHDHHDSSEPQYELVYVQDNYAKRGLAPYYYGVKGGHHGGFLPACDHSLLIGFTKELSPTGVKCSAFGVAGSGSYAYQWYGWRPDTIFVEEGVHDFGNSLTIEVPIAVWNMILVVNDLKYGITAEYQEMVYPTTLQSSTLSSNTYA
jgi:hypothetical protein